MFTSPVLLPLVAQLLEEFGALDKLESFVSTNGRKFYGIEATAEEPATIIERVDGGHEGCVSYILDELAIVPFMAGKKVAWRVR